MKNLHENTFDKMGELSEGKVDPKIAKIAKNFNDWQGIDRPVSPELLDAMIRTMSQSPDIFDDVQRAVKKAKRDFEKEMRM